jgi:hypothetical protein
MAHTQGQSRAQLHAARLPRERNPRASDLSAGEVTAPARAQRTKPTRKVRLTRRPWPGDESNIRFDGKKLKPRSRQRTGVILHFYSPV